MGLDLIINALDALNRELILFCCVWFLIGALWDFSEDLFYIFYKIKRRFTHYRHNRPMQAHELPPPRQSGMMAVFVPAWREAGVIGGMLDHCGAQWAGDPYRLYVGCYVNDPDTVAEVMAAAARWPAIRLVLNPRPGPTTKADCLNRLWRALLADEARDGVRAKAVILHDAEDMVHADEIRIHDRLIEKKDMVQLPVVPLRVHGSRWISGHYCDEFAESHGKHMVVREALGVGLPSSGVGCAFSRGILGELAAGRPDGPFDASSLTEDYELGLRIAERGGRGMMARIRDRDGQLVATRACFPATLEAAVRQKTRWMTGIALAGWDRLGWQGGWRENWMRLYDRRGVMAALVLSAAYLLLVVEALLALLALAGLYVPPPTDPALTLLMGFSGLSLGWRLCMRALFVGRLYGPWEAAAAIPRTFISNLVAILSARRAFMAYVRHCAGQPLTWDKTVHVFPAARMIATRTPATGTSAARTLGHARG